jgi:hypothetical protein
MSHGKHTSTASGTWEGYTRLNLWDSMLVVLCLAAIGGWYWTRPPESGKKPTHVLITAANKPTREISLLYDRTINIRGHLGLSTIRIENGKVRFIKSVCRNKVCIHSGWHQHGGVACMPNRVTLELKGHTVEYDAYAY